MRKRLRPYWSAFRVRALLESQYRGAALGGIITQGFFSIVLICLYRALYAGQAPQEMRETITYVWLQQMFFHALLSTDGELMNQIMSGSIAYSLIRPIDQQCYWMCRNLALKVVGVLMRNLPMLPLVLLLPDGYTMLPPASGVAFGQFLLSLMLGFLCITQISSICEAFVMITLDRRGINSILSLTMAALSGNIIPLTLFPERVQTLIRYQPFAQGFDAPIRIYLHAQSLPEYLLNLSVQLLWLAVLTLLARALWKRQLNRMTIQGG